MPPKSTAKRVRWEDDQVALLADLYEENGNILEDETTDAISMKRKKDCRQMISDRISAIGPVWDAKSVKDKIKAMKIAVKKKYSARFEADGSEKAPGEYEPLTEIEQKFCARVSKVQIQNNGNK